MAKPSKNKQRGKHEEVVTKKRALLPLRSDFTSDFVKSWTRYERAGRVNLGDVKIVMSLIVNNDGPLPSQYKDHALVGDYAGFRECHVRGDHLLIYKISADGTTVIFTDMGTHAELFE